jgi:lysophospholipase L1-like esterase
MKKFICNAFAVAIALTLLASCQKSINEAPEASITNHSVLKKSKILVVLGSSTAAGVGLDDKTKSWVGLMDSAYSKYQIINLAIGRICTYHIRANGDSVPGKPHPDTLHNITMALSYNPSIIIINLPSNDVAYGLTVEEYFHNLDTVIALARKVTFYITTPQPRDYPLESDRQKLIEMYQQTVPHYGKDVIDFWTGIANPDGTIIPQYNVGDGIHLNYAAHRIFFNRVDDVIKKLK